MTVPLLYGERNCLTCVNPINKSSCHDHLKRNSCFTEQHQEGPTYGQQVVEQQTSLPGEVHDGIGTRSAKATLLSDTESIKLEMDVSGTTVWGICWSQHWP